MLFDESVESEEGEHEDESEESESEDEDRKEGTESEQENEAKDEEEGEQEDEKEISDADSNDSKENEPEGKFGQKELRVIIEELNEEYEETGRPFRIIEIAGGFHFATTKEYGEFVGLLSRDRARRRLSPAALETISIVAYRQPVTKPEVEAIRGVNCDQVLLSLLERNLIAITGRGDSVGKPLLYGTTDDFLRAFGLNSLSDLPKLRELEELMEDDAYSATKPEGVSEEVRQELLELDLEAEATEGDQVPTGEQTEEENATPADSDETNDNPSKNVQEQSEGDESGEETSREHESATIDTEAPEVQEKEDEGSGESNLMNGEPEPVKPEEEKISLEE